MNMSQTLHRASPPRASNAAEDFERLLSRLSPKARASVDKHVELCSADAALGYGRHWKRLAGMLARLAPHMVEVTGAALKFHLADGKYRLQVFALEDTRQGVIRVFMPDVAALAVKRGLLRTPEGRTFPVAGDAGTRLELEEVNAETKDLPEFCRAMLGWGRKAVHTSIPSAAEEKHVRAVERLCELAAEKWATPEVKGK
jgi:hypothetical protein